MKKEYIPKAFVVVLFFLITAAIVGSFKRNDELNKYGKFTIAKLGSFDKGFKGKYILYFELNINGEIFKLNGFEDLPYRSIIDSFQRYGLPVVYSSKNYKHFSLLINCEAFSKYHIDAPENFSFLNCK